MVKPGLYETILLLRGRPMFLDAHLDRFFRSATELGLGVIERVELRRTIEHGASDFAHTGEAFLRITLNAGAAAPDVEYGELPERVRTRRELGRVVLLPATWRRTMPQHKTWPNEMTRQAIRFAAERDADEALFVDDDGSILEGSSTNVFVFDAATLRTPPLSAGILPGVLRQWILDNAIRAGLTVEETMIGPDDLRNGSFVTSSLTGIATIRALEGTAIRTRDEELSPLRDLFRETYVSAPDADS